MTAIILESAEMRWFFRGSLPASERMFGYANWGEPEVRTDCYLAGDAEDGLGIKIRESRLEIKVRRSGGVDHALSTQIHGTLERWCKWSLPTPESGALEAAIRQTARVIDVEKRRWLRKYSLIGGQPRIVEREARPNEGCGIEVTRLRCQCQDWWSFGLEAFGKSDGLEAALLATANSFLGTQGERRLDRTLPFTPEHSFSYPRWLARLAT